jgi:hypothetical protein
MWLLLIIVFFFCYNCDSEYYFSWCKAVFIFQKSLSTEKIKRFWLVEFKILTIPIGHF